jgi:hypothetical protein
VVQINLRDLGGKSGMTKGSAALIKGLVALVIGSSFVGIVMLLGHHSVATPIPFVVLSPGIFAGALVPGSGFNPEGDMHPWGPLSTFIVYAVNIAIYGGLIYLFLSLASRLRKSSR